MKSPYGWTAFAIAVLVGVTFVALSTIRIWRGKAFPMKLDFAIILTGIAYVALAAYASYLAAS